MRLHSQDSFFVMLDKKVNKKEYEIWDEERMEIGEGDLDSKNIRDGM
jgi:hypothetical protein